MTELCPDCGRPKSTQYAHLNDGECGANDAPHFLLGLAIVDCVAVAEARLAEKQHLYSPYIELILRWLAASGVPVDTFASNLPPETLGRCYNTVDDGRVHIEMNAPNAYQALLTIAHEAGHWLGNEVFGHKDTSDERERQAFKYGWRVLCLVGADEVVTLDEWKAIHPDEHV